MGCSSSAHSAENVRTTRDQSYDKDKPQASVKPTSRDNEVEKTKSPQQKTARAEPKSEVTNGAVAPPAGQNKINTTTQKAALPPVKKPLGPNVLPKLSNMSEETRDLLYGKFQSKQKAKPNLIRFFHCAVPSDSGQERKKLFQSAYCKLRQLCNDNSFTLEVTDLNWNCSVDAHLQGSLLLHNEMESCRETAFKTFFVIFLNDKYGGCCPQFIPSSDMQSIKASLSPDDTKLISDLYKEDLNCSPPRYCLQTPCKLGVAKDAWSENAEKLLRLLQEMNYQSLRSDFERAVREVIDCGIPASDIVVVRRQFTDCPEDVTAGGVRDFKNVLSGKIDDFSDGLLNELRSDVESKTVADNFLTLTTPWVDSVGVSDDTYLAELDGKFCELGSKLILDAVKEKKDQDKNLCGIPHSLRCEMSYQRPLIQTECDSFKGQATILAKLTNYLENSHATKTSDVSTRYPMVLHGPSGCGKSAICGMLAQAWQKTPGWTMGVCVARFVGSASLPRSMHAVLHSICMQIDTVYGLSLTRYCKSSKQLNTAIKNVLASQPPQHPLLVIIDGVDQLIDCDNDALSWLPGELSPNIRIVLSTSRPEDFKNIIPDNDYFLEVPKLEPDSCAAILSSVLTKNGRALTAEQNDAILCDLKKEGSPLYACIVANMASCLTSASVEKITKENLKELVCSFLENIEKMFSKELVSCVLSYLCISPVGLSDMEVLDLILCDTRVPDDCRVEQLPRTIWPTMRNKLSPLLKYRVAHSAYVACIANDIVRNIIRERYATEMEKSKSLLLNYFVENSVSADRKLAQEMRLLILSEQTEGAKNLLFNFDWLSRKLNACGIFDLLYDIQCLMSKDKKCEELRLLHTALCSSAMCLACHPSQLAVKLNSYVTPHVKTGNYPLLKAVCQNLKGTYLLPSSQHVAECRDGGSCDDLTKAVITGIFRIPSCPNHVVSVATDKGQVGVWDFVSGTLMRCLTGVEMPRNIRMVDSERAAVLCNRELKVYNLDAGTLQAKMKGVLNVKMPFFGIHDVDHVVALSRNRMYVNIMNMNTGDMAATFKVGEDRFLNSLLVSQNGETCVCGDEVQKPFPLLVWDLLNRKLIHDFRIAGHEFLTNMAAITNDGHYVVCVCKELDDPAPNFIIVYDIQSGQLFKKWKPDFNTTAVGISSESNLVVTASEDAAVMVWDMVAGSLRYELCGHVMPVDTIKFSDDGQRCISYDSTGKDMAIHLWELTSGKLLGVFSPDEPVSCCEISSDGCTVLVAMPGYDKVVPLKTCELGAEWSVGECTVYGDDSFKGQSFDVSQAG